MKWSTYSISYFLFNLLFHQYRPPKFDFLLIFTTKYFLSLSKSVLPFSFTIRRKPIHFLCQKNHESRILTFQKKLCYLVDWKHFKNEKKKAFYFTSKALFVLKIFKFFLDFLVMYRNGLIKMIRLISNFVTSQPG